MAGLTLGTAGTVAASELGRRQDRAELLAEVEIEVQLARTELSLFGEERDRQQALADSGFISEAELGATRHDALKALFRLQGLELDQTEIRLSGGAPDRRLSAPVIAGRDFVLERLANDQGPLTHSVELQTSALERARILSNEGRIPQLELKEAERDLLLVVADLENLEQRKQLRKRFVEGELTVADIGLAARLQDARTERHQLSLRLVHAHQVSEARAQQQAMGLSRPDRRAELELARLEAKYAHAERRLQAVLREAQGLPADLLDQDSSQDTDPSKANAPSTKKEKGPVRRR